MLLGGSRWSVAAHAAIARFAERFALPVATTFRRGALFDALHPCYAGDLGIGPNPKLIERIKAADLVLLVGGRLGEMPSQSYTLFDIPGPQTTFVHVHPGAEELGRVYKPHLAIHAAPTAFAARGISPPGFTAFSASADSPSTSPRRRARWATACRPRSASSGSTPSAPWCASRAMATS
jgi:acetolactate synthase-1/2/3 large subunit